MWVCRMGVKGAVHQLSLQSTSGGGRGEGVVFWLVFWLVSWLVSSMNTEYRLGRRATGVRTFDVLVTRNLGPECLENSSTLLATVFNL